MAKGKDENEVMKNMQEHNTKVHPNENKQMDRSKIMDESK